MQQNNLTERDIDTITISAMALERTNLDEASALMKVSEKLRKNKLVNDKIRQYKILRGEDQIFYPFDFLKEKIFIIGKNKTGTTSLHVLFKKLGFAVGSQPIGERLIWDIEKKDYYSLKLLCESAQVFQDVPFSFPKVYEYLHSEYPNAFFINLERDNEDVWYKSLINYHRKFLKGAVGSDELTIENLSKYRKGYLLESHRVHYGLSTDKIYDEVVCKKSYLDHIKDVKEFFKDSEKFISINLKDSSAPIKLATLLGIPSELVLIPHTNKS